MWALRFFPAISDADYISTPHIGVRFATSTAVPHTLSTVKGNRASLPILNFGWCTDLLRDSMTPACVSCIDEHAISAFVADTSCCSSSQSPANGDIDKMIIFDLLPAQTANIQHMLKPSCNIFDNCPFSRTSCHSQDQHWRRQPTVTTPLLHVPCEVQGHHQLCQSRRRTAAGASA